jgi:DNA polymerase-4
MNLDTTDAVQLELPLEQDSGTELDAALDQVRERFGSAALTRGSLVGRDQGYSLPMLPD